MSFFNNNGLTQKVIKENAEKIGDLSSLKTTEKSNLVGAINEVDDRVDFSAQEIIEARQGEATLGANLTENYAKKEALDVLNNKSSEGESNIAALEGVRIYQGTTEPTDTSFWYDPSDN